MADREISRIKDELQKLVSDRGHVTFVEIMSVFPDEKGNMSLEFDKFENLILWTGMSQRLVRAISQAIHEKKVYIAPAGNLTYLIDGGALDLPVAKSVRSYKHPRWLPVTLHHSPPKS